MSAAPKATAAPAAPTRSGRRGHLHTLHRRTYPLRSLGMGLAGLAIFAVLREQAAPAGSWAWMVFTCLLWPQLAYLLASRSRDPLRMELRNFVFDSFIAASWVPLMHFNTLPSVVLVAVVMADKINTGVRGLWLRSLPGMAVALVGFGLLTGFAFQPRTSMTVLLASLPILVIHTLAVSMSSYRLVRRVQRQNLQLEELNRVDALTGLDSRSHWQLQAEALLQRCQRDGTPATLMLVDVDHFKEINDRYGHAVGDDVLGDIARLIREQLGAHGHAGRLGGDEFVLAVPMAVEQAQAFAERLRSGVEGLPFPSCPGLRCSVSIGFAAPGAADTPLREWLEATDRALYRAKHAGRNRTEGRGAVLETSA